MKSVMAGALVSLAMAGVAGVANAGPCIATTYAGLMATNSAGGCNIGDKQFANFDFVSNTATIGAANVGVANIAGPPQWGFLFNPGLTTGQDVLLTYSVSIASGTPPGTLINSDTLNSLTGSPNAHVDESYCLNATTTVNCLAANMGALHVSLGGLFPTIDSVSTPGGNCFLGGTTCPFFNVTDLAISKNISGGSTVGSSLSSVSNTVDQTSSIPEPASLAILGASLLGFGAVYRRRFRK